MASAGVLHSITTCQSLTLAARQAPRTRTYLSYTAASIPLRQAGKLEDACIKRRSDYPGESCVLMTVYSALQLGLPR